MPLNSSQVRQQFLDFFAGKGHTVVPSAPVVPHDDPTLLFTNAGMNQFKDVFLGTGARPYTRAVDSQKCIRAGGKHNDLDDVGRDTYHHTFFEMLGNWSFGDYFKAEAIQWAWELLTGTWGVAPDRLHATYFEGDPAEGLDPDLEARDLWLKLLPPEQVHPGNKHDNFWEMGDIGPCGPCSEIHVDLTSDKSGGPLVNAGDHRVMEIWNLVFIQFNRTTERLVPLPARHVDTGMGFERICAVLQAKASNYDTDVFTPVFEAIQTRTKAPAYAGTLPGAGSSGSPEARRQEMIDVSYRVIADHLRCLVFALADGALPSNEGRGYVLRRILRRAVRYGRQYFEMHRPFLADLVPALVEHMRGAFPDLAPQAGVVEAVVREEESSFGRTLDRGIRLFDEAADRALKHHHGKVSGADAFKLHDTYGFPIDLTELMAEERGLSVNIGEYERLMDEARTKARGSGSVAEAFDLNIVTPMPWTDDAPKYADGACPAVLLGYVQDGEFHDDGEVPFGGRVALILDRTCFYGEQGGQVGDTGVIEAAGETPGAFDVPGFRVADTAHFGDTVLHVGEAVESEFPLRVGDRVRAEVDPDVRDGIMRNHTGTHLLNWALRDVLGGDVQQKGSLVDAEKTRFDFSHARPVSAPEMARVDQRVNEQIQANHRVYTRDVNQGTARRIGTLRAVFGEKYPDVVRVVSIGADIDAMLDAPEEPGWMEFSVEFCGGTHLASTASIGPFVIVSEEGVAKGVRRVVGVTGPAAEQAARQADAVEAQLAALEHAEGADLAAGVAMAHREVEAAVIAMARKQTLREQLAGLQTRVKAVEKEEAAAAGDAVRSRVNDLLQASEPVGDVAVVTGCVPAARPDALRGAVDWIRSKSDASAVLLVCADGEKVTLLAGMSRAIVARGIKAGDLIREIAPIVGGKGGGRPDMAQGGGSDPSRIDEAVLAADAWIRAKL